MALNRKKYPKGWRRISTRYRFEVAGGRCEQCGKRHGTYSPKGLEKHMDYPATRIVKVYINSAHRKRDPSQSNDADLIALCPHCHALYDMDDIQAKKHFGLDYKEAHQLTLFPGLYEAERLPLSLTVESASVAYTSLRQYVLTTPA